MNDANKILEKTTHTEGVLDKLRGKLPTLNFAAGLTTCCNDEDFYLELLKDFVNLPIKEELTRYLVKGDYKNYCIRIHGFKNNAYSVGAVNIGDMAYEMEKLTKGEIPDSIKEMQDRLFEQYDYICTQYRDAIQSEEGGCQ